MKEKEEEKVTPKTERERGGEGRKVFLNSSMMSRRLSLVTSCLPMVYSVVNNCIHKSEMANKIK